VCEKARGNASPKEAHSNNANQFRIHASSIWRTGRRMRKRA